MKTIWLQATLYTLIGLLTPASAVLASDSPLTPRSVVAMIVVCIIAGATALKAFLSTNFADHERETNGNDNNDSKSAWTGLGQ